MGNYKWQNYDVLHNRVLNLSNGLLNMGLKSSENLVLFCETRPEWIMSALACFRIGVPGKLHKQFLLILQKLIFC